MSREFAPSRGRERAPAAAARTRARTGRAGPAGRMGRRQCDAVDEMEGLIRRSTPWESLRGSGEGRGN